jgi:serine/threonine protein kinase
MSPDFKSFLKGLLNKTPNQRLTWPHLLEHPFVRDTVAERSARVSSLPAGLHALLSNGKTSEDKAREDIVAALCPSAICTDCFRPDLVLA